MDFLPENFQTALQHPAIAYLQSTTQDHLTTNLSHLRTMVLQPYVIEPVSAFLATYSHSMPDIFSALILFIILLISLKIVKYAFRVVMFWILLAFKIVFWGSVLGLGWYIYNVGVENATRDAGWLWGVLSGFVGDFEGKAKTAAAAYANTPR